MRRFSMMTTAVLAMLQCGSAAERIVDGVGGATNRYATILAAVTAATTGDTVRILSGLYSEDEVSVNKRLTFVGNGYRNISNGGTHINSRLNFIAGSTGSRVVGFRFLGFQNSVTINGANDILVANNLFSVSYGIYIVSSMNDTVRNNILFNTVNNGNAVYVQSSSNIVVCNNTIRGAGGSTYGVFTHSATSTIVYNNFFSQCGYGIVSQQGTSTQYIISGNIFYSCSNITNAADAAILYSGNLLWNSSGVIPNNGADNATGDPLFVKFETSSGYIYQDDVNADSDLRIQIGSPAIDLGYPNQAPLSVQYQDYHPSFIFGTARSDAGIYGGPFTFPYPLGAPTVPSVVKTTISPAVVSPGGTLNVNVSGALGGFTGRNN